MQISQFLRVHEDQLYKVLLAAIFLLFIACAGYFAFSLRLGVVPDEVAHFALSKHFATTLGTPPDVPETYQFSYIGHRPTLYYWINGRILGGLHSVIPSFSEKKKLISLRLVNVGYSLLALVYLYLLAKEALPGSKWWRLLVLFLLSNTLMFTFLSGGLNYDNLVNLLCFAAVYYLVRVVQGNDFYRYSIAMLICIALGSLVKITVLPMALIIVLIWAWYIWKERRAINFRPPMNAKTITLAVFLLGLGIWNIAIYGVNMVRFRALTPRCEQVLTDEQCNQSPVVAATNRKILARKLTLRDVAQGTGDDPFKWFTDFWMPQMTMKIYGIMGHERYYPKPIVSFYRLAIFWTLLVAVRYWKRPSQVMGVVMAVGLLYTLVLLRTNYDNELLTGFKHPATQGRYIFPAIGALYVMMVYFMANIAQPALRAATLGLVLLLFSWGSPLATLTQTKIMILPENPVPREQHLDEIERSDEVSQVFISECKGRIEDVRLRVATLGRVNTHPIIVRLVEVKTGRVVAENIRDAASIKNNLINYFPFASPVYGTNGKEYRIVISSPESVLGNAVTVWASRLDSFPRGEAYMNDTPLGVDLNFQYRCVQPFLSSWFH